MQKPKYLLLVLFMLSLSLPAQAGEGPRVVVSIKPIHSLVAAVMLDLGEPELILSAQRSPHNDSLKPSQARKLQQADVVFWVGPKLETFLKKPLQSLAQKAQVIALSNIENLTKLPFRNSDLHEEHDNHVPHTLDPHLWLDPLNGVTMVDEIKKTLIHADPKNATQYELNSNSLQKQLLGLNQEIFDFLKPVQGKPYFVFHDAYQYFEKRFSLQRAIAFTARPEMSSGARHLSDLSEKLLQHKNTCLFLEPQFSSAALLKNSRDASLKTATLDPLGINLKAGPQLYPTLIRNMAKTLKNCLVF